LGARLRPPPLSFSVGDETQDQLFGQIPLRQPLGIREID
jgi:hypothetical protein